MVALFSGVALSSGLRRLARRGAALGLGLALGAVFAGAASAAPNGQPQPWQMNLSAPATPKMADIVWFHNGLLVLITVICLFVAGLLAYVGWRFHATRNPTPSRTTHNTMIEIIWTVVPVLILVVIAIPSFRILRDQLVIPPSDITLKITGKQWYWTWDYPADQGGFAFDSLILDEDQRLQRVNGGAPAEELPRQLAVDNEALVPVGKVVRLQVTAADVVHKFAMPAFGLKLDAIPGRLNETWFRADREGIYYGQCSFICGQNHAYMPIAIRVVSEERYAAWLNEAKERFAAAPGGAPATFAAAR